MYREPQAVKCYESGPEQLLWQMYVQWIDSIFVPKRYELKNRVKQQPPTSLLGIPNACLTQSQYSTPTCTTSIEAQRGGKK